MLTERRNVGKIPVIETWHPFFHLEPPGNFAPLCARLRFDDDRMPLP